MVPSKVSDGLQYVMGRARGQNLSPLDTEGLDRAIAAMNGKKAKGVDAMGPIEVQRLPPEARQELLGLLQQVEQLGEWPHQLSMVIGAVAPKPKGATAY